MADFLYLLDWISGLLFAGALAMTALGSKELMAARLMVWAALIISVMRWSMWGLTTEQPWYVRAAIGAVIGGFLLAAIPAALRWVKAKEAEVASTPAISHVAEAAPPPNSPSPNSDRKKPFFEVTNRSTVDARDATIPSDFPAEQFAKVDSDSLLNMRGLQITKTEQGGWIIQPGKGNIEFPKPPEKFAFMPTAELQREMRNVATKLRELQNNYRAEARQAFSSDDKNKTFNEVFQKYDTIYQDQFADLSLSLAASALKRIGQATDMSREAQSGGALVFYKKFAGPTPASDIAAFLDTLADRIPH